MIYTDFVFSGLKESYFHNIRTLIKPLFEFDNVNISGMADMILSQKEDVGTVIKNEDEDETKNTDVDLFAVFSLLPISHYYNGNGSDSDVLSQQVFEYLKSKIEKYSSESERSKAFNILKSNKIGLLINERFINMPQEAIPICLNFLIKEIGECKEEESYDGKFEFDYIVVISKFVKRVVSNDFKKAKKGRQDNSNGNNTTEEILHYKYETEHFQKKAEINFSYKIPYDQMNMEYLENKNEPQYFNILFIKTNDFLEVVNYLGK
jgi:protein BCP1